MVKLEYHYRDTDTKFHQTVSMLGFVCPSYRQVPTDLTPQKGNYLLARGNETGGNPVQSLCKPNGKANSFVNS